jgi:hypothetical protein
VTLGQEMVVIGQEAAPHAPKIKTDGAHGRHSVSTGSTGTMTVQGALSTPALQSIASSEPHQPPPPPSQLEPRKSSGLEDFAEGAGYTFSFGLLPMDDSEPLTPEKAFCQAQDDLRQALAELRSRSPH